MKTIDTCGMSCPQPVLMTKTALERETEGVDVVVDNNTAKGNVLRFLEHAGFRVQIEENNDGWILRARK